MIVEIVLVPGKAPLAARYSSQDLSANIPPRINCHSPASFQHLETAHPIRQNILRLLLLLVRSHLTLFRRQGSVICNLDLFLSLVSHVNYPDLFLNLG